MHSIPIIIESLKEQIGIVEVEFLVQSVRLLSACSDKESVLAHSETCLYEIVWYFKDCVLELNSYIVSVKAAVSFSIVPTHNTERDFAGNWSLLVSSH